MVYYKILQVVLIMFIFLFSVRFGGNSLNLDSIASIVGKKRRNFTGVGHSHTYNVLVSTE
jgi:hypothetical protein